MAKDCSRSHAEIAGDVGQRCSIETFGGEEALGAFEDLFAADARRSSHL